VKPGLALLVYKFELARWDKSYTIRDLSEAAKAVNDFLKAK
jgi:hypothetical protein